MSAKKSHPPSLDANNDDLTTFLDTIDTFPPPPPPVSTNSQPPSMARSATNSPLPPPSSTMTAIQTLDSLLPPSSTTTPLHQDVSTDPSPSSHEKSKSSWSSLGSWLQNVVMQETQVAKSVVSQNMKSLGEMTQHLLQESQTATQKLRDSVGWPHVLDPFSDPMAVSFSFQVVGLSHVQHLDQDCTELIRSLFAKRSVQTHLTASVSAFRSFVFEEVSADVNEVYEKSVFATPPDGTPHPLGIHIAPVFWHHQYLIYLCTVHGFGHVKRTLSQSILKETKDVDEEWERLVLRSAIRASLDEWVHAIDFKKFVETHKFTKASSSSSSPSMKRPEPPRHEEGKDVEHV